MNYLEKVYSIAAILFAAGLITSLLIFPQLRLINRLIPICLLGFIVNIGLMFIVLRDIFIRCFDEQNKKYLWVVLVLLFWPSVLYYLPRYGFHPRND